MAHRRETKIELVPPKSDHLAAQELFKLVALRLSIPPDDDGLLVAIRQIRKDALTTARALPRDIEAKLVLAINVLCDLKAQGWDISGPLPVVVTAPRVSADPEEAKRTARARFQIERNAQLALEPTQRFVRRMETSKPFRGEWHSIFSLMRDGSDLADEIRKCQSASGDHTLGLEGVIRPYLQFVDSTSVCKFTGLRLGDIWRYFRHTWSTPYQSIPGRKMHIIVRDAAAPNHAVIGIAALGSAVVQLSVRDDWIGWSFKAFLGEIQERPTLRIARWLEKSLTDLIGLVYHEDLCKSLRISDAQLLNPSEELIAKLRLIATKQRGLHQLLPGSARHKSADTDGDDIDWANQARTRLFRSKRALALADLLEARRRLRLSGFDSPTRASLVRAVATANGRKAVQTVLRYVKAAHVGIDMMDITVCGAIAPYSELLGGKLVSLLMASPEITREYRRRYSTRCSVIASSIAGRAVKRVPRLVLLGTTSLYASGASQYNRIKVRAELVGGKRGGLVAFTPLGYTAGYGSYHFSVETMQSLNAVLRHRRSGRQVNSIFGEGVSPKFRKVRDALDAIGFPADQLLQHGNRRLVYSLPLADNFRDVLLGLSKKPGYLLPQSRKGTQKLVSYWHQRWFAKRVSSAAIMARVASHQKDHPIQHQARVRLIEEPFSDDSLFAEVGA